MAFRCFFITKLFEIDELLARIIVQLRKQPDSHRIFSIIRVYYGSNVINCSAYGSVSIQSQKVCHSASL